MAIVRLSELIGQPDAQQFLKHTVASGRIANAYLFHGATGAGKGTAALAFARALLCEARGGREADLFGGSAGSAPADAPPDDACGVCRACLKTATLQHPDLKFLFPVSGEEKELDTTVAETIEALRTDPFFVFTYEKAASIRLSRTREVLRELAFKPFEGPRRVVVLRDADRMREDQYSALLKAIEEPGASTVWLLTTSRTARLPDTIRSRCQKVRLAPWPEAMVASFLVEQVGASPGESRMLAALSGGALGRALALRDANPLETRNLALQLLEPALRGDSAGLWRQLQGFNRSAGRETLRRVLEFQQLWLRDLLRARYGAGRDELVNRDREAELRRQAERLGATEVRRRLMAIEEAMRAIEGNISPDLAMFSATMRTANPSFETTEWPAHLADRWSY